MNNQIISGLKKALRFALWGTVGGAIGALLGEVTQIFRETSGENSLTESVIFVGIWFGIIGGMIAVTLLMASSQYLKRGLQLQQALKNGIWVGFLSGAIAGGIAQYTYQSIGPTEFLRVICWGIAGGLLGLGLSFRIPNLGKIRGVGGGFAGGVLGGGIFVLIAILGHSSEIIARLLGIAAIGFCIGLMLVIIETVFREAWLEVHYNPQESLTISLGDQGILIGSDSNLCTVYVPNVAPVALRYQIQQGQIICEDVTTGNTRQLQSGEQQTIGNITIVVCGTASNTQRVRNSSNLPPTSPERNFSDPQNQFFLHIQYQVIPLTDGTQLTGREIIGLESKRPDGVVAEVNHNPQDPRILGLKNCSYRSWIATPLNGTEQQIDAGRSIKLAGGTKINFGLVKGEIVTQ